VFATRLSPRCIKRLAVPKVASLEVLVASQVVLAASQVALADSLVALAVLPLPQEEAVPPLKKLINFSDNNIEML